MSGTVETFCLSLESNDWIPLSKPKLKSRDQKEQKLFSDLGQFLDLQEFLKIEH